MLLESLTSLNAAQLTSDTVNDARLSANVAFRNANNAFSGSNHLTGVTVATNTGNVFKGNFTGLLAGNVTGDVTGNLSGNATSANTANSFTGSLVGDVTGTQGTTVVASIGGQSAASVASATSVANAANSANTANAIVKRDGLGNFSAGGITAGNISAGTLAGDGNSVTNLNGANILSGTVGSAQLAANAVQTANIAAGAVGSNQLASGAAVANLNASGQSGVAIGGILLSTNSTSPSLAQAGYVNIGRAQIGESWSSLPNAASLAGRDQAAAIWTGTELIVWGGRNDTEGTGADFRGRRTL